MLNTASVASSHREGSMDTQVAAQSLNIGFTVSQEFRVYLFPNPRQRFALWIWPGTIQVSRSR